MEFRNNREKKIDRKEMESATWSGVVVIVNAVEVVEEEVLEGEALEVVEAFPLKLPSPSMAVEELREGDCPSLAASALVGKVLRTYDKDRQVGKDWRKMDGCDPLASGCGPAEDRPERTKGNSAAGDRRWHWMQRPRQKR